ncbi:hypothetical protein D3C84_854110 [compost metagenome]
MNNGIHRADGIDLTGKVANLFKIAQVADCRDGALVHQFLHGRQPGRGAHMHDNLVALGKEGLGGGMAQSIGRAGNEYAGFAACIVVPLCVGRGSLPSGRFAPLVPSAMAIARAEYNEGLVKKRLLM